MKTTKKNGVIQSGYWDIYVRDKIKEAELYNLPSRHNIMRVHVFKFLEDTNKSRENHFLWLLIWFSVGVTRGNEEEEMSIQGKQEPGTSWF
jgi:hypothetical protein